MYSITILNFFLSSSIHLFSFSLSFLLINASFFLFFLDIYSTPYFSRTIIFDIWTYRCVLESHKLYVCNRSGYIYNIMSYVSLFSGYFDNRKRFPIPRSHPCWLCNDDVTAIAINVTPGSGFRGFLPRRSVYSSILLFQFRFFSSVFRIWQN